MGERVGNPVPAQVKRQLERSEVPPGDPGTPAEGTWAARLTAALDPDDQHELLLTKNRIAVVITVRKTKGRSIALSLPHDASATARPRTW